MESQLALNIALHLYFAVFLSCGVHLWMNRSEGGRARAYIGGVFISFAFFILTRVIAVYTGVPAAHTALPIMNLYGGLAGVILVCLYPIELMAPGWIKFSRVFGLFLPWMLLRFPLMFCDVNFRVLTSFDDLWQYKGEFNVWLRLLILALILCYCIFLFFIPRYGRGNETSRRYVYGYAAVAQGIGVFYILFVLTGNALHSTGHLLYSMVFCLFVTRMEFRRDICVPLVQQELTEPERPEEEPQPEEQSEPEQPEEEPEQLEEPEPEEEPEEKSLPEELPRQQDAFPEGALLWDRVCHLMDEEELWRNPDLGLVEMAATLKTNRTTLMQVIQAQGFTGYREFIINRRMDELLKLMDKQPTNIQDAYDQVGFRSRTTMLRHFKERTGLTPTEYLQQLSQPE